MSDQTPRPIPKWAWVIGVLFFPSGMFVAYGSARLLSWGRSILLAAISYLCIIGFVRTMVYVEHGGWSELVGSVVLSGGVLMFCAWGFALYRIGQAAAYWSPSGQRGWRRAGWCGVAAFSLSLISILVQAVVSWRTHP